MMTAIRSYARQGQHTLRRWLLDPRIHTAAHILQFLLRGFFISAASLGQYPQPLALGLVCAGFGWPAVLTALGSAAGYYVFWGSAGLQGIAWLAAGLPVALLVGSRPSVRRMPMVLPAIAGLITAAAGLAFQLRLDDTTPVAMYLLRMVLSIGVTRLFLSAEETQGQHAKHLVWGVWVLALAQAAPLPWLCLGYIAAAALGTGSAFTAAVIGGLALDLAQITPVPMTAVICVTYFLRLIPGMRKWVSLMTPGPVYLLVMALCGVWDLYPLPALVIGGLLGHFLPESTQTVPRRGETGIAQVRLELAAGVFSQMQMLLTESSAPPIDENALVCRAVERACGGCPNRKSCKERETAASLPAQILHRPLLDGHDLGFSCRKEGRILNELHRAQEQLRTLRGSRELQKESRSALLQQYQFLSEYLQDLSDELGKRVKSAIPRYKPQVSVCANRGENENGDRFQCFAGTGCSYYILLCDGMGKGIGAMDEGRHASALLKKLLTAGFPAEYALRSLNSLCALRGMAGAVTVDLAQLQLDTGKVLLYKWGAAASYLLTDAGAEKIGTAGPPPGLSVTDARETVERLSLRRGETLVLCSDGVGGEDALRCAYAEADEPPGELAARILEAGKLKGGDDATVAVVRLIPDS